MQVSMKTLQFNVTMKLTNSAKQVHNERLKKEQDEHCDDLMNNNLLYGRMKKGWEDSECAIIYFYVVVVAAALMISLNCM